MKQLLYALLTLVVIGCKTTPPAENDTQNSKYKSPAPEFCADSAFRYVAEQCAFGPRVMNTAAHDSCGNYIAGKFAEYGATIYDQRADGKMYDGTVVKMRNIIAALNPTAPNRIIISGHWDSRMWADHDSNTDMHHTPIDGANDGASSIGVMIEMARQLFLSEQLGDSSYFALHPQVGIDFICWDAEDNGTPAFEENDNSGSDSNTWCLGSQHWAEQRHIDGYKAMWGINLDMVGGANTEFCREGYSMCNGQALVNQVWAAADRIGYGSYFKYDQGGFVTDDHVQVIRAGFTCIDIIGNERGGGGFPSTWHTANDNLQNIDRNTLKAVGQTMLEVLWTVK